MTLDELAVALRLKFDGDGEAKRFQQALQTIETRLNTFNQRVTDVGRNLSLGLGVAVAAFGTALIREGMAFEDQMTEIEKKSGATADQMKKIKQEILDLSTSGKAAVPIEEIAAAYERGAAAGLPIDQLEEFSLRSVRAADAFKMSGEEVANFFVGIQNALGVPEANLERIADLINSLGDAGIANESGIVQFIDEAGAMGKTLGLTVEETAAFGAALQNLKVPAGQAATAMNSVWAKLAAPESLPKGARVAFGRLVGDTKGFAKALDKDADTAIVGLLKRLKTLDKATRTGMVSEIFGGEHLDTVLQMVEGVGKLEESLHLAGRETEWLGSLQKSYAKRLDDTSARWQLFVNNGRANLLAMGDKVLPVFGRILDRFSEMMTKARSNGALNGMGDLVAKAFEGIEVVVENVGRHFDFLAKNWGKIEPYLTAIGAAFLLLAARLWPVGAVLAGLGLAIDEVLGYMAGADTVIGPFIESLARFLGTEPEKVAELLGGIGKAVAGFLGGAIGVAMFASAISSLGRALMVITGAQAAIGILSRIAGIGWGSAAAGAGAAAAGAAGAAGVGAAAGAAGAGAAGAGAAGATGGAAAGAGAAGAAGAAGGAARTAASVASRVGAAATSAGILGLLEYKFSEMTERTAGFMREFEKRIGDREKTPTEQVLTETPAAVGMVAAADIASQIIQLQSTISSWFSPLEGRLDAIESRVDSAFATTAGGSSDQNTLGMKAAFNNFAANLQAMRGGMPAGTTTMTFAPVDNRAFPVSVSAPVSVNVTQAAQAPAAVGNAISAAVQAGANAMPPARISGGSAP